MPVAVTHQPGDAGETDRRGDTTVNHTDSDAPSGRLADVNAPIRLRELIVRYVPMHDVHGRPLMTTAHVTGDGTAASIFAAVLQDQPVEVFAVLCLSVRHLVLGCHLLSRGTLDGTIVQPCDVLRIALLANSNRLILGHNHPSGDPAPSESDISLTTRVIQSADLLGILVLDHIVVGDQRHYSFREKRPELFTND